jgi:hypothetical protein
MASILHAAGSFAVNPSLAGVATAGTSLRLRVAEAAVGVTTRALEVTDAALQPVLSDVSAIRGNNISIAGESITLHGVLLSWRHYSGV